MKTTWIVTPEIAKYLESRPACVVAPVEFYPDCDASIVTGIRFTPGTHQWSAFQDGRYIFGVKDCLFGPVGGVCEVGYEVEEYDVAYVAGFHAGKIEVRQAGDDPPHGVEPGRHYWIDTAPEWLE